MAAGAQPEEKNAVKLKTVGFVLAWFAFNISMANVAKWLFMYGVICIDGQGCVKYDFPLTMTSLDILFGRFLSQVYLAIWLPNRTSLSMKQQFREIAPLGACFALSVGMGNLSLKYIFPSFNQMIGASSPLITVIMAVLMGTRYNLWTWLCMPVICGGLAVCVTDEQHFHALGAASCIGAAILRGVKSIVQARLLSGEKKLDSVELLYYMSPYAAAVLYIFALFIEGIEPIRLLISPLGASTTGVPGVLLLLLVTAFNAWFLSVANFLVTYYTSPVTLQVLGNVKTCFSIIVSVTIFGNPLTSRQCVGVFSCLFGVWLYGKKGHAIKVDSEAKPKDA